MIYDIKKIPMPPDYEGAVNITIISSKISSSRKACLYIHGYVDYFFQDNLAAQFNAREYSFYALELRKYGRSFIIGQHFNYCRSLDEYFADISRAIEDILADGNTEIVLLGHSTGGLLASLYASRGYYRDKIGALVLNSPFLEFNVSWFKRKVLIPIVSSFAGLLPYAHIKNDLPVEYGEYLHQDFKGSWSYDLRYKPVDGMPLYIAWLRAIYKGQKELKQGLDVAVPTLVLSSSGSKKGATRREEILSNDIVLNVKQIKHHSKYIGNKVVYKQIDGAIHDLFISDEEPRHEAFAAVFDFLKKNNLL